MFLNSYLSYKIVSGSHDGDGVSFLIFSLKYHLFGPQLVMLYNCSIRGITLHDSFHVVKTL